MHWKHIEELMDEEEEETWGIKHKRALRCAAGGSTWTQARLFDRKLATTDKCRRCRRQRGTLWHRHYGCDATAGRRREQTSERLRACAAVALAAGEAVGETFARAIFPDPRSLFVRLEVPEQ